MKTKAEAVYLSNHFRADLFPGVSFSCATAATVVAEDEDGEDEIVSPTRKSRPHVRPSDIEQVAMTL